MKTLFVWYPKCSTCQKAEKWLLEHGVEFSHRHILAETPTAEELALWAEGSGLPLRRFFNTSGLKYRELGLKERLPQMGEAEQLALLAGDGMLIKRPLVVGENFVLVGFRPAEWEQILL